MHGMESQNERKTTVRIRAGTRKVGWEQYILWLPVFVCVCVMWEWEQGVMAEKKTVDQ